MKCPVCLGTGKVFEKTFSNGFYLKCSECNGTGKIGQTNEEQFCRLPTDEKAEFLDNIPYSDLYDQYDRMDLEKWLKEKHKEGEA